jgi:hypothetical protein
MSENYFRFWGKNFVKLESFFGFSVKSLEMRGVFAELA